VLEAVPEDSEGRDTIIERIVAATMPGAGGDVDDVGNVAAFAASDQPRTITGSTINIACGMTVDSEDRRAGPFSFRGQTSVTRLAFETPRDRPLREPYGGRYGRLLPSRGERNRVSFDAP
jgi:hypothetical protein